MRLFNSPIVKNASWIIACKIVQAVLNLIISMITARYLGPSNYGLINYAMSVVSFFAPIMNLGISNILVNEILDGQQKEHEILGTAIGLTSISALLCMVGTGAFVSLVNAGETETIVVCLLYSVSLLAQSWELIRFWFQAMYLSKYTAVVMLTTYAVISVYKIAILVAQKSVYWFAVANALDYFLIAMTLMVIYRKISGHWLRFSSTTACKLMSKGRYYIISNMMVTLFAQTDRIMIKMINGETAVGYYSAAMTIAGMTTFVFVAIIDSMRPAILSNKSKDRAIYEGNIRKLYCLIIYLAFIQSIAIVFLANYIVPILYGSAYLPAVKTLRIMIWYTMFSYIGAIRDIWILAEGKHAVLWKINLLGAIVNIYLNALWIPRFGIDGAAAATFLTQVFTNVIVGYLLKPIRYNNKLMLQSLNPWKVFGKPKLDKRME